jgi:hypothetical protein
VRARLDGLGPYAAGAAVCLVIGVLAVLIEVQSPSFVQWHGIRVHADTYEGLTTYRYGGVTYSLDNVRASARDERHVPTTVWLPYDDPTDTERAYIDNPYNRWTDFVLVTGWFAAAAALLGVGLLRRGLRQRRRDTLALTSEFGTGISPDFVQRILAERQAPRRTR